MNIQLNTPRVQVRPILESDAADVLEILGDEETAKLGGLEPIENMDEAIEYTRKHIPEGQVLAIVRHQTTPEVVGIIEVFPKFFLFGPICPVNSYCLAYFSKKSERGNGYTTEAIRAVKRYLFDQGISELTICVLPRNRASRKVALKCGLSSTGIIEEFMEFNGKREDIEIFNQVNPAVPKQPLIIETEEYNGVLVVTKDE